MIKLCYVAVLLNIKIYTWLIDPVYGISREDTKENSQALWQENVCVDK